MKLPVRVSSIVTVLNIRVLNGFCAIECRSDDGKLQCECAASRVSHVKTGAQTSQCEMEVLGYNQGKVLIGDFRSSMNNFFVIR